MTQVSPGPSTPHPHFLIREVLESSLGEHGRGRALTSGIIWDFYSRSCFTASLGLRLGLWTAPSFSPRTGPSSWSSPLDRTWLGVLLTMVSCHCMTLPTTRNYTLSRSPVGNNEGCNASPRRKQLCCYAARIKFYEPAAESEKPYGFSNTNRKILPVLRHCETLQREAAARLAFL